MQARELDLSSYPRKAHFDHYRVLANPYVGVTAEVDVTELAACCKARKWSFYLAFLRAAALAANRVPELRRRIRGEGIVEYDCCDTSHIELLENGTYCYCTLRQDQELPLPAFLDYAEQTRRRYRERASIEEEDPEGMFFVTSLPWLHYTAFVQPTGGDSNPRISWGKFERDCRGRLMLPLTLLCHHALADGLQISQFYRETEAELKRIKEEYYGVYNL